MLRRYNGRAKNKPINSKHKAAPNGSSITPSIPCSTNSEDAPIIVSDPNQVANNPEATTNVGILLPAMAKSSDVCTFREAYHPTKMVTNRYKTIKINNIYSIDKSLKNNHLLHHKNIRELFLKNNCC